MASARGPELINRKIINGLKNKPSRTKAHASRTPFSSPPIRTFISSGPTKNHQQLPGSNSAVFSHYLFCWWLEEGEPHQLHEVREVWQPWNARSLVSSASLCPLGPFHPPASSSTRLCLRDIDHIFDLAAEARTFLKKGGGATGDYGFREYLFVRY